MINRSQVMAILPWLKEKRALCWAGIVLAGVLWFALATNTCESRIRLSGLGLQILGLATVAWGIHKTRKEFGHPPLFSDFVRWLGRFPPLGRPVVGRLQSTPGIVISTGQARGYKTASAKPDATVEERIAALEENIGYIHERIQHTHVEIDKGFASASSALKQEAKMREDEDAATRRKLESSATGGVHIEATGAVWLLFGAILSTAAPEIAYLLK